MEESRGSTAWMKSSSKTNIQGWACIVGGREGLNKGQQASNSISSLNQSWASYIESPLPKPMIESVQGLEADGNENSNNHSLESEGRSAGDNWWAYQWLMLQNDNQYTLFGTGITGSSVCNNASNSDSLSQHHNMTDPVQFLSRDCLHTYKAMPNS